LKDRYWLGFFVAICLHGFTEDVLGKDRYLLLVQDGWVNTPWWIWLVGIGLAMGSDWYCGHLRRRADQLERDLELRKFTIRAERRDDLSV
jgi:hypothetical protein